jgi:hypothetical protein
MHLTIDLKWCSRKGDEAEIILKGHCNKETVYNKEVLRLLLILNPI